MHINFIRHVTIGTYKYLDLLYVRHKNVILSAFLFYLRISAARKLPT